ncbi:MAG: bifunctional folylpolyglutamate synthase/dihydrofolate synthase [Dysgonamonadaceae bacterium]|jgi:dihydrofolate synthase/folylpolyglutamate synthase|nr:bifunctional folylpolyglutamate synthase/dihydrofolate synthase [Dysgonamonadaceae bacterium]
MTYDETIKYLYDSAPMFQRAGASAYKEGMENTFLIDKHLNYPHTQYKTIHVGGTNGKGSTCHLLASVLQEAGYRTGLYTSPHLLDFRERIKVNGRMIDKDYIVGFIAENKDFFASVQPSFFELTTGMAFAYFAEQAVDVSVIEVGLGGKLDCTNVITPVLSVITNISFDHTSLLGNTLATIAGEKAGIIKPGVPAVIGEAEGEVREVFESARQKVGSERFLFAEDVPKTNARIVSPLQGFAQEKNTATVLCALDILKDIFNIPPQAVVRGFANVIANTGLAGRWQVVQEHPRIVLDAGHNAGGMAYNVRQLQSENYDVLHIVFGMVNDKDISAVLRILPVDAKYYFTQANLPRALDARLLAEQAGRFGLKGEVFPSVAGAFSEAKGRAGKNDFIFVGGSAFVVAEILSEINN